MLSTNFPWGSAQFRTQTKLNNPIECCCRLFDMGVLIGWFAFDLFTLEAYHALGVSRWSFSPLQLCVVFDVTTLMDMLLIQLIVLRVE